MKECFLERKRGYPHSVLSSVYFHKYIYKGSQHSAMQNGNLCNTRFKQRCPNLLFRLKLL